MRKEGKVKGEKKDTFLMLSVTVKWSYMIKISLQDLHKFIQPGLMYSYTDYHKCTQDLL